jgi:hypothetical protein
MKNERMYSPLYLIYEVNHFNFWKTPLTLRLFLAELYWMSDKDQHLGIWEYLLCPKCCAVVQDVVIFVSKMEDPRKLRFHGEHDDFLISAWCKSPWTNVVDQFGEIFFRDLAPQTHEACGGSRWVKVYQQYAEYVYIYIVYIIYICICICTKSLGQTFTNSDFCIISYWSKF